jgi:sugar lactone lactonase YvrE
MKASLLYRCEDMTGEGATWLPRRKLLLWVDIDRGLLRAYRPGSGGVTAFQLPGTVTAIIPCAEDADTVWLAMRDRIVSFHLPSQRLQTRTVLSAVTPGLRTNDCRASPEGRLWTGVMHPGNHCETGALYCLEHDFSCREALTKQCIPNGIVWNEAGDTMYYADSGRRCIYGFAYDRETGAIHSRRTAVRAPEACGLPDGMAIDSRGFLWVAHWGGFGVCVWNPENGELVDRVEVPVPNVASCAFGGEGMDRLFITTARSGLSAGELEKYPLSGSLFAVATPGVVGKCHYPFHST